MLNPFNRKSLAVVAAASSLVALSACSSNTATPATGGSASASAGANCDAYKAYGDLHGKTVTVYTSIASDAEAKPHIDAFKPLEQCTGVTIKYEGSREFETQLPVRIKAGNAPDIAYLPQPGLLQTIVTNNPGKTIEIKADDQASKNVDENYNKAWRSYGTVDGKYYGVPVGANAKSFVWYSPKVFKDKGYQVPKTWAELMTLTDKIAADYPNAKPWCAGFESGSATGWPGTDWIEDMMLRTGTPEDYDKWVTHQMAFNDAKVVKAFDQAGSILKNPKYVNGSLGDVKSIATTPFTDAGFGILHEECFLHRQASFYQANWAADKKDVKVAEDGDVFAFYLPGPTTDTLPMLAGGEFAAAFRDAPEVKAVQAYLTSPEWSNAKAKATPNGGWLSANKKLDPNNLSQPIDRLAFKMLVDDKTVVRFDGSDLMPGAVGAGSFWKGMTDWVALDKSSKAVVDGIEATWPKK